MNSENLKKLSIQIMIGCIIAAATIAVIAVLVGSFSDTFAKALFTLGLVAVHALASLAYIEKTTKGGSTLPVFNNTVFVLIVLSFFTSVLGVWQVLPGELIGKLYATYFIILFASLHGEMLAQTLGKRSLIDNIVYANFLFVTIVVLLIMPLIWIPDNGFEDFYYRLLAACGIVDATLTILAVILHRLYIQKHPKVASTLFSITTQLDPFGRPIPVQATAVEKRHLHPLLWLLIIYLGIQIIGSILFAAMGAFYR